MGSGVLVTDRVLKIYSIKVRFVVHCDCHTDTHTHTYIVKFSTFVHFHAPPTKN